MGKILEEEQKDFSNVKNVEDPLLPMEINDEVKIQSLFAGKYIAIYEGKIIAVENSLNDIHKTCDEMIPEGKGCLIDYIEESVGIYGFKI